MSDHVFVVRLDGDAAGRWRGSVEALTSGRRRRFDGIDALMEAIAETLELGRREPRGDADGVAPPD